MPGNKLPILFRYRLLWHVFFWVVIYMLYVATYGGYMSHYFEESILNLILMPVRILGTYSMIYILIPYLLRKRKFVFFTILAVLHACLYGFLLWITLYFCNLFPSYADYSVYKLFYFPKILYILISNYGIPVLAAIVVIFKRWYLDEQLSQKLAKEKLQAELKFLKAQIHPHFLFNTLNNLYALTLIKSDKTPDIVLKLSGLLDYMLYNSNEDFVLLEKEIDIIKSYIELEKIRYDNRLDLTFEIEGDLKSLQIAPLILLPFIENSFKHGASTDRTRPVVQIKIYVDEICLNLSVANSIPESNSDKDYSEGIGLKNVKRRLDLIYPEAYSLDLKDEKDQFRANLKLFWKKKQLAKIK